MVGKNELQDADLGIAHNLGVRMDFHAFPYFGGTGRHKTAVADDFDGTDAAARFDPLIGMVTEVRDVDVHLARGIDDLRTLGNLHGNLVDGQMDEFFFFSH